MNRRALIVIAGLLLVPVGLRADIILSAAGLNDTLKKMQRLLLTINGTGGDRAGALFQLGTEGDALATLLNDEVAAHGSQEKQLIDLALSRTKELGVLIAYDSDKKKFFYDGEAFRTYLKLAPSGPQAAGASFKLLEGEFFRLQPNDPVTVAAAAERKRAFLRRFPRFSQASEVHLMLCVDYRDLHRLYREAGDRANQARYRDLTRQQLRLLMKRFPNGEHAEIARRMLERFEAELKTQG